MSLSSDGSTVAIGGPGDSGGMGATWIFCFDGIIYQQLGPKLLVVVHQVLMLVKVRQLKKKTISSSHENIYMHLH